MFTQKQLKKFEQEHKLINGVDHKICNKHHICFPNESPWFPSTEEYFYRNDEEFRQNIINNSILQRESGYTLEWQRNNPDKIKIYNELHNDHKIDTKEWIACKQYFNNECAYCGLKLEDHWVQYAGKTVLGDFHKDHVIHDGEDTLNNCVPSCKSCNCSKHTSLLEEWYNENNPNYTIERKNKIIQWLMEDYKQYITK